MPSVFCACNRYSMCNTLPEKAVYIHKQLKHSDVCVHLSVQRQCCCKWKTVKAVDSRVSLLLNKHRSMETEAANTEAPFLPVAGLIQWDLGRQCLQISADCNLITTLSHTLEVSIGRRLTAHSQEQHCGSIICIKDVTKYSNAVQTMGIYSFWRF